MLATPRSVGDIVKFHPTSGGIQAAIVASVNPDHTLNLMVINNLGVPSAALSVSAGSGPGHWSS